MLLGVTLPSLLKPSKSLKRQERLTQNQTVKTLARVKGSDINNSHLIQLVLFYFILFLLNNIPTIGGL